MYLELTFLAYLIDKVFGEFGFIRHPVVLTGDYIKWFEKYFYKDSVLRGAILVLSLIGIVFVITLFVQQFFGSGYFSPSTKFFAGLKSPLPDYVNLLLLSIIASTAIASKMLYESVKEIITHPKNIKYLVSRDTTNLNDSDINKAAIETYAENLSDGVIAPLFYLLLFGLEGAFIYKTINTLDSMVGYRNLRYEKFGKVSAKVDDVANYIPSRITAGLIALLMGSKKAMLHFYHYGKKYESPNAGYPISAMALAIGITLGGDSSYFGKVRSKPFLGEGRKIITIDDIVNALSFQLRFDILLIILSGTILWV